MNMQSQTEESACFTQAATRAKTPHLTSITAYFGRSHIVKDWTPNAQVAPDSLVVRIDHERNCVHDVTAAFPVSVTPPAAPAAIDGPSFDTMRAMMIRHAQSAWKDEPNDIAARARTFLARLSGSLSLHDAELADQLFALILRPGAEA